MTTSSHTLDILKCHFIIFLNDVLQQFDEKNFISKYSPLHFRQLIVQRLNEYHLYVTFILSPLLTILNMSH